MSDLDGDQEPRRRARRRRLRWPLALALVLVCAAGLVVQLSRSTQASRPTGARCAAAIDPPEVEQVAPKVLGGLREAVARALPQRVGRLYEEGTVRAAVVWSDDEPSPPATSPTERRPGGYEMRWWAPNGDDLVADVFVFSSPSRASRFLALAAGARCHEGARRGAALRPPMALNLSWTNPDGALQADVFMARGRRVYRIADAPAGSSPEEVRRGGGLAHALATIDVLACLLPSAGCTNTQPAVPA